MHRKGILISLVLVLLICSGFTFDPENHKFTKEYQSSSGVVVFNHESHSMDRDKDCSNCHSALKIFGGEVSELLAHNYCKACHEANNGPTECNGCHDRKEVVLK